MWDNLFLILGFALTLVSVLLATSYGTSRWLGRIALRHDDWAAPQSIQQGRFPSIRDSPTPYREPEDDAEIDAHSLVARWSSYLVEPFLERSFDLIGKAWGKMRPLRWLRVLPIVPVGLVCLAPFLVLVVPFVLIFPFAVIFDGSKDWRLRIIVLTLPIGVAFNVLGAL